MKDTLLRLSDAIEVDAVVSGHNNFGHIAGSGSVGRKGRDVTGTVHAGDHVEPHCRSAIGPVQATVDIERGRRCLRRGIAPASQWALSSRLRAVSLVVPVSCPVESMARNPIASSDGTSFHREVAAVVYRAAEV